MTLAVNYKTFIYPWCKFVNTTRCGLILVVFNHKSKHMDVWNHSRSFGLKIEYSETYLPSNLIPSTNSKSDYKVPFLYNNHTISYLPVVNILSMSILNHFYCHWNNHSKLNNIIWSNLQPYNRMRLTRFQHLCVWTLDNGIKFLSPSWIFHLF